ncbi:MAG: hypothetical protein UDR59_04670, partial [Christensenellales bacterium]|nr:hypothetical protein [Christensenellales bacterium]
NSGDDTRKNFSRARENSAKSADSRDDFGGFSADGGAAVGFREISLPLLYNIGLDGMRAGRISTARHVQPPAAQNHHDTPLPSTIRANAPRRAPFCPFGVFALRSAAQSGMMKSAEIAF